jgi:isopenicillin-N epimerase
MNYGKEIIGNWFMSPDYTYLNHGSFGAAARCVLKKASEIESYIESHTMGFFMEEYPNLLAESKQHIADFVNVPNEDLVFVENATTGVATVLRSLMYDLKAGDKILLTNHIYTGVDNTLDYLSKKNGVELVRIDIPFPIKSNEEIISAVKKEISSGIKIAVFDHIASATALIFPIKELCELCRENGVISIIDGAHAPGMLDLDISSLGSDFFVGNCHKWLFTQKGCAILYVSKAMQEKIHPLTISNFYGQGFQMEFGWTATKNVVPWLTFPTALEFYKSLGDSELRQHNHSLVLAGGDLIYKTLNTKPTAPNDMIGAILTCDLPEKFNKVNPDTFGLWKMFMEKHKIEIMFVNFADKLRFRISAQAYNELEDYEKLCQALKEEYLG